MKRHGMMTKFRITAGLEVFNDVNPVVEYSLDYMNSSNEWGCLGFFPTVEAAKVYAAKFAAIYQEEIFSI